MRKVNYDENGKVFLTEVDLRSEKEKKYMAERAEKIKQILKAKREKS